MPRARKPKLPVLLDRKILKTGQTRGADDDVIYQNRVKRCNTVLIPYHQWKNDENLRAMAPDFEQGYIVLINPQEYFAMADQDGELASVGLSLGHNCLVFYETREEWNANTPDSLGWNFAVSREDPLGGKYVARVPGTTAIENSQKINLGYHTQSPKGAGIRLYEYASSITIDRCRNQLEAIYWHCYDAIAVAVDFGMTRENAELRKSMCLAECADAGLLDYDKLYEKRIIDSEHYTVCPFCLKRLSANGFYNRLTQAEGREVPDLTVTEINLFHIDELRYGEFNHRPYNLGWGCHHCNVVVKDSGIYPTLHWLKEVIKRNEDNGYDIL